MFLSAIFSLQRQLETRSHRLHEADAFYSRLQQWVLQSSVSETRLADSFREVAVLDRLFLHVRSVMPHSFNDGASSNPYDRNPARSL